VTPHEAGARGRWLPARIKELLPQPVKEALRRRRVRAARLVGYPVASAWLPRPPLDRGRPRMRLAAALLACDLNPGYLGFWPLAARAWEEIVGVEALLVLVAGEGQVPPELAADPRVLRFDPLPGLHTTFQAQCIRLLYPALLDVGGAVLVSDIDLLPLDPRYFHRPVAKLPANAFVAYRDIRFGRQEMAISFNAAAPATWAEVLGVGGPGDVRERLASWGDGLEYDGRRAWPGWYTDQQLLYEALWRWPARPRRLWLLDDEYCGFRRLDRLDLEREQGLGPRRRRDLERLRYTDYNCLSPFDEHRRVNELVLELGLEAASRRRRGEPRPAERRA